MPAETAESEVTVKYPILGTFFGCCAYANVPGGQKEKLA
jgi:hypothetical protein